MDPPTDEAAFEEPEAIDTLPPVTDPLLPTFKDTDPALPDTDDPLEIFTFPVDPELPLELKETSPLPLLPSPLLKEILPPRLPMLDPLDTMMDPPSPTDDEPTRMSILPALEPEPDFKDTLPLDSDDQPLPIETDPLALLDALTEPLDNDTDPLPAEPAPLDTLMAPPTPD